MAKIEEDREAKLNRLRKEFGSANKPINQEVDKPEEPPKSIVQLENTKKATEQIPSFLEGTQKILHQAPSLMGLDVGSIFEGITNGIMGAIDTFSKSTDAISKGDITGGLLGYGWGTGQGLMGLLSVTPQLGAFTTAMDKIGKSGIVSDNTMQAIMNPVSTLLKEAEKDPELMYQIIANAPPQLKQIIESPMGRESLAGVTDVGLQGAIFHGLTKGVKKFGGQEVKTEITQPIKETQQAPIETSKLKQRLDEIRNDTSKKAIEEKKQIIREMVKENEKKTELPKQKPVELVQQETPKEKVEVEQKPIVGNVAEVQKIERRTDKAGKEYYFNTETKKRTSKEEFEKLKEEKPTEDIKISEIKEEPIENKTVENIKKAQEIVGKEKFTEVATKLSEGKETVLKQVYTEELANKIVEEGKLPEQYVEKVKTETKPNILKNVENAKIGDAVLINYGDGRKYEGTLISRGRKNIKVETTSSMYGKQELTFPTEKIEAYIPKPETKVETPKSEATQVKELVDNANHFSKDEKAVLLRQYERGVMNLNDIKKMTTVDARTLFNEKGEINKWGNAIENTRKQKSKTKYGNIEEAKITEVPPVETPKSEVKPVEVNPEAKGEFSFNTSRGTTRTIETLELRRNADGKLSVDKIEDYNGLDLLSKEFLGKKKNSLTDAEFDVLQEGISKKYGIDTKVIEKPLTKSIKTETKVEGKIEDIKPQESTIERLKREALDEFKKNQTTNAGFNPLAYKNQIKYGAGLLKEGAVKFADWSQRMIKDLGEKIKPQLLRIWSEIKKFGEDLGKIGLEKISDFVESKYNPARPLKIVQGDAFKQRFQGIQNVSKQVQKAGLDIPEETFIRKVERLFADKLNRGKTIIREAEKTKPVSDVNNFKMQAELYSGRAKDKIDKRSDYILNDKNGFLKRLNTEGLSIDDLGEYMLGKHAKERNAYIETKHKKKNGSGITDAEADRITKKWQGTGVEKFADEMNTMVQETRKKLLDAGIISKDVYDILSNQYKFYVPLKGTVESVETGSMSKGFSVESTGIKRAKGRGSISDNPVIRMIMDANDADIRIEKNKVMKSFHDFATEFPSDAWSISKRRPFTMLGKDQLGVYIDGKQKVITIKDAPLLRGLKNLGVERGFKFLDNINTYMRAVNTYYNPEFLFNNFARDAQTALINIGGEKSISLAKKVSKDIPLIMKDIWKGERGGTSKWFKEYKEDGGKMSWLEYKTPTELADTFAKQVKRLQGKGKLKEAFVSTEKFISDLNDTVENAFRVSVYKNLRESGMSREQAASYGKSLTVNFNRKGEYGRALNSLYLFWNAGMQGSVRIIKALKSPRTRKIVAGIAGLSASLNLMNRSIDEEGYNQIPDWEKDSNWIFMTGGGKYLKIRQPYGYNVFSVLGNLTADGFLGKQDVGRLGGRLFNATTDAFNPFGQAGSISQFFAPTALDPIIQFSENKKFSGAPIRKDQPAYQPKVPDSQLYFKSVRPLSKEFTDWLNKTTGGSETESGTIDINPSNVDFWVDFVGGGTGKFISNSVNTGSELLSKGDFPELKNIPFARSVIGETMEQNKTGNIYDRYDESGRTKFSKEEWGKFIKDVTTAMKDGTIKPEVGKNMIKTFIKGQSKLRNQKEIK